MLQAQEAFEVVERAPSLPLRSWRRVTMRRAQHGNNALWVDHCQAIAVVGEELPALRLLARRR